MATNNANDTPDLTTNGQILIGSTGTTPSAATITGDATITVTNGAGSITVASSASGGGALVKIATATASASASIDFTDLSSTYFLYMIRFNDVAPATDATTLIMRTSTNNGSSFDSGVSDYGWTNCVVYETGAQNTSADTADAWIEVVGPSGTGDEMGNGSNETASGLIYLYNPSAAKYTFMNYRSNYLNETADNCSGLGGAYRLDTTAVDAVSLLMDSGNITSGTFVLYGVSNT